VKGVPSLETVVEHFCGNEPVKKHGRTEQGGHCESVCVVLVRACTRVRAREYGECMREFAPLQEAALQLAACAIANSDHEFGLELCKRAGTVIYDPRICCMMGECE